MVSPVVPAFRRSASAFDKSRPRLRLTLTGTVDGDQMTGTFDFGDYGEGDCTAVRIK